MTLIPGTRLGPYEIVTPLGAGGMGEVYRAHDSRLGREVAIKVLPAEVASDPDRLRRFEQEAKAVSALNHPHIVTLYEVGESDQGPYLVLEKIDGRSLRELLHAGALPVKRVLTLGAQIAEGLAKAHAAGIVHRDLKPENVMVTDDGFAKILDFGLAKLVYPELEGGAPHEMTTLAERTASGMILGTLGYLSPEQAAGRPADFRADQFALGALLFEMATGERPFRRETTPESLAAVIREEPEPLRTKNASLPAQLGWLVERCLAKDPNDRYGSTRDLAHDLADLRDHLSEIGRTSVEASSEVPHTRLVRRLAWPLVSLALAGVIVWQLTSRPRATGQRPPSYRPLTFQRGVVTGARFSPDGQTVYYSAAFDAEPPRVYMTRLEGTGSVPLDLPPATLLSVSTKGELALLLTKERNLQQSPGTLARASALGGTPRPLLDGILDADWAPDGEQLAVLRDNYDLELPPGRVLVPRDGLWPRVSPRGDRIAYTAEDGVRVVDLQGRPVLDYKCPFAFGLAWRPDGREIWFTGDFSGGGADRVLYALSLSGERRLLATAPGAMTIHDIARDGTRALVETGAGWWGIQAGSADRAAESTLDLFGRPQLVGFSGDGKQTLLYEYRTVGKGLYLRSTDGSQTIRLSDDPGLGLSPDGRWALTRRAQDPAHLFLIPTGAGEPQQVGMDPTLRPYGHARWSLDGQQLFVALAPAAAEVASGRVYRLQGKNWRPVTPDGVAWPFAVSPDGRTIAALDLAGSLVLSSADGGEPRRFAEIRAIPIHWSSDGNWLYLLTKKPFRAHIDRLELASGRVEPWREFGPSDPAGVFTIGDVYLSTDGRSYAYSYSRVLSVLYLVEGLQ